MTGRTELRLNENRCGTKITGLLQALPASIYLAPGEKEQALNQLESGYEFMMHGLMKFKPGPGLMN